MSETDTLTGGTLAERIAGAMGEAGEVTKSGRNLEQGYNFASAEAILKAVRTPLFERGIILTPSVDELAEHDITSKGGAKGTRVVLSLTFTFRDGKDELAFKWRGEGQDYGDKAYGKAYTNAVKTFIRTAWLLPTEHDDPEASSPTERAVATNGDLPAWAKGASKERIAEANGLVTVLGAERTRGVFAAVKGTLGEVPDVVVNVAKLLATQYAAALDELGYFDDVVAERNAFEQAQTRERARAEAGAEQDAAAEEPDPPAPDPAPQFAPGSEDDVRDRAEPSKQQAPGTVEPPDAAADAEVYRAAGCTCPDPAAAQTYELLTEQGQKEKADTLLAKIDRACPIRGHGIAF